MSTSAPTGVFSSNNFILNSLKGDDLERLLPYLEPVELPQGKMLYDVDDRIRYLYFLNNGMISVVNVGGDGVQTEVGVIGREGFSGVEGLLGDVSSINRQMIQLPGDGYRARIEPLQDEMLRAGAFQQMTHKLMRAGLAQIGQTSLCNRLHKNEERLAKWLLMCHDRFDGDMLPITHEFAAIMLGANRTSVTQAAGQLQDKGLITYSRGKVRVTDRPGLEAYSCECYRKIAAEYARLTA